MENKLSLKFRFYLVVCNRSEKSRSPYKFSANVGEFLDLDTMACRFTVLHGFLDEKQTGRNIFEGTR